MGERNREVLSIDNKVKVIQNYTEDTEDTEGTESS